MAAIYPGCMLSSTEFVHLRSGNIATLEQSIATLMSKALMIERRANERIAVIIKKILLKNI